MSSPVPAARPDFILCYYLNATNQIQLARVTPFSEGSLARVVFPGQRWMFEAHPDALLEIYTHCQSHPLLFNRLPCQSLQVNERISSSLEATLLTD